MKLRLRTQAGATVPLFTAEVCSLAALRTLVAQKLGVDAASVRLSLNNRDEARALFARAAQQGAPRTRARAAPRLGASPPHADCGP